MTKMQDEDEINLLDYLIILLKRKKVIFIGTFGLTVIVGIIVFILPTKYQAEVRFMPPPQSASSSLTSTLLSTMGGSSVSSLAGSLLGVSAPGEMYVGLLTSRTVLDKIIDKYNLMKRYDHNWIFPFQREDARKKLTDDIMAATADDTSGIVDLTILDEDPKVAAAMANSFLDEMETLSRSLSTTEANQRRIYYEGQLKDVTQKLAKSEDDMKVFQEKTGVLAPDAQAQAVLTGDATLRAQIAATEVQIKVAKTYSTPNNPDLQKLQDTLKGLEAQLSKIEGKGGAGPDPLMPTGRMPSAGLEYARKLRDVKFYEALYDLLTKQYEAAKLDEAKNLMVVQEVDRAVVPTKGAAPKRLLLIVAAAIGGLFLSIFAAFFLEFKEKASGDADNRERIDLIKKYARLRAKTK